MLGCFIFRWDYWLYTSLPHSVAVMSKWAVQAVYVPRLNKVEEWGLLNYPLSIFPSIRLE